MKEAQPASNRATMMRAARAQVERVIVRGSDAAIKLLRIGEQGRGARIGLHDPGAQRRQRHQPGTSPNFPSI
jgi:hypothetical protein